MEFLFVLLGRRTFLRGLLNDCLPTRYPNITLFLSVLQPSWHLHCGFKAENGDIPRMETIATKNRAQSIDWPMIRWIKSLKKPAWAPSLVFVIHLIAYTVFDLYETYPLFDIPMHFVGGLAMAYFLDQAFVNACLISGEPYNRLIRILLVFTSTCTIAVFWEFQEFVLSWVLSTKLQGDLADTMKDLLFGMSGSVFILPQLIFLFRRLRVFSTHAK